MHSTLGFGMSECLEDLVKPSILMVSTGEKVINTRHYNSQEFRTPPEVKSVDMSTRLQSISMLRHKVS